MSNEIKSCGPSRSDAWIRVRVLYSVIGLVLMLVGTPASWGADEPRSVLTGKVIKVIDADTIDVQLTSGPIRVRFHGIDAPEHNQPWGNQATTALKQRVLGKSVDIEPFEQDRYNRMIGIVYLSDVNINAELVQQGNAWAYRQYMRKVDGTLCAEEAAARIRKSGLWSQSNKDRVALWEWRKRKTFKHFTDFSDETTQHCVAAIGAH